jgi:SAM-dependent methyltransferase
VADGPRLYREFASWWPIFSAPDDYAGEAAEYRRLLPDAAAGEVRTVLELGSGGGNNASHLKRAFELTLVDRSSEMLAVSRRLNPECEHIQADMRTVRLGRAFDAVFVHDAVAYITGLADLAMVAETAYVPAGRAARRSSCPTGCARPSSRARSGAATTRATGRSGTSNGGGTPIPTTRRT